MERGHTEALIPMVERVLVAAALAFRDLDLIAVTVGPGAFTGLRVGLAAARGIALAADIPCIGVTTLEAIAAAVPRPEQDEQQDERIVLVVLETKRGDFYAQAFSPEGIGLAAPRVVDATALPDLVEGREAVVAGDAAAAVIAELRAAGVVAELATVAEFADAGVVADIAARRFPAKEGPLQPPSPLYVRRPEAQLAVSGGRRRP
jgi:tRNA threonylcarbamoyladenosine biosynthesis protein TsaB